MVKRFYFFLAVLSAFSLWFALPPISASFLGKKLTLRSEALYIPYLNRSVSIPGSLRYGLDIEGGSHLVFMLNTEALSKEDKKVAAEATKSIIEQRINFLGVSESEVLLLQKGDVFRISVDLPGEKNPQQAIQLIGKTAQLNFREVVGTEEIIIASKAAQIPRFKKTILTGKYLKKARLAFDQQSGEPQVSLQFNKEGSRIFAQLTRKNLNKPLAIFLDESLIVMPTVQSEIKTGEAVITGRFTIKEAKQLVLSLNAGALPVSTKLVEQKTIEATLGRDNILKSFIAGIIGLFSVILFMVVIYRKEGLVAVFSLTLYALYSIALYKLFGVVLTLSGIAGFILSVGMAVDANILIYERIKEERLTTIDRKKAVRTGFFRALGAIKEANINTLLVCFILFNPFNMSFLPQFGAVRGFAVTLAIGVMMSLLTGVFITKNFLWSLYGIDAKR